MNSPTIGRTISFAIIALLLTWAAVRTLGGRPPESPKGPVPKPTVDAQPTTAKKAIAVVSGGCFWGVQAVFEHTKGVSSVVSGYTGGSLKSPSYEMVSTGVTGHAESVKITYDPSKISYGQLLMIYFSVAHDPTQLDRQGPDSGSQYRSSIFYVDDEQKRIAENYITQLNAANVYSRPIVTKVVSFDKFYPAEDYHQDYLKNNPTNPYIVYNDMPKIAELKKEFPELYREY